MENVGAVPDCGTLHCSVLCMCLRGLLMMGTEYLSNSPRRVPRISMGMGIERSQ